MFGSLIVSRVGKYVRKQAFSLCFYFLKDAFSGQFDILVKDLNAYILCSIFFNIRDFW